MPTARISRTLVRELPAVQPGGRKYRVYDTLIPGFCVEKSPSGRATYWLRYTDTHRRRREARIGRHGDITADQARRRALELKAEVSLGGDPAAARDRRHAVMT